MENLVSKNKVWLLIIPLLLIGCAQPPKLNHTWVNTSPNIKIRFTPDFTNIRERYKDDAIIGLTLLYKTGCTMYIPPIEHVLDYRSMCIAGHELMHCVYGIFHDDDHAYSCSQ